MYRKAVTSFFILLSICSAIATVSSDASAKIFTFPIRSRTHQLSSTSEHNSEDSFHFVKMVDTPTSKSGLNRLGIMGNTVEYFAEIIIGSNPGQLFTLQIDTGSAITAIPSVDCVNCYHYNPLYNESSSTTAEIIDCKDARCSSRACNPDNSCKFSVVYGDRSNIHGKLVSDTLSFPTYNAPVSTSPKAVVPVKSNVGNIFSNTPFLFASIDEQNPPNSFQYHGVDGIMGMSYNSKLSCVPNCVTPIMDLIVQQYSIPNVFSLSLQNIENNTKFNFPAGSMTIGGFDPLILAGSSFHHVPFIRDDYYTIRMADIRVGNDSIGMKVTNAIVDSGTTFCTFPQSIFEDMVTMFQKNHCELPFVCGTPSIFDNQRCINSSLMTEEVFNKLPEITFYFDGVKTVIPPRQYMQKQQTTDMKDIYCFGIIEGDHSNTIVLGNTFMKGYYITFDRDNSIIGFANKDLVSSAPFIVDKPNISLPIIIGAAVGGFILISVVVIIIVIIVRRQRRIKKEKETVDLGFVKEQI